MRCKLLSLSGCNHDLLFFWIKSWFICDLNTFIRLLWLGRRTAAATDYNNDEDGSCDWPLLHFHCTVKYENLKNTIITWQNRVSLVGNYLYAINSILHSTIIFFFFSFQQRTAARTKCMNGFGWDESTNYLWCAGGYDLLPRRRYRSNQDLIDF